MKKFILSAISLAVLTSSATAATTEELLQEIKALRAENAALRSKNLKRETKFNRHTNTVPLVSDHPSIKGESEVAVVTTPVWQGFYAGMNAGYGFGTANNAQNYGWGNPNADGIFTRNNGLEPVAFAAANSYMGRNITQGGFIGGGQVGYNYQYGSNFVLGIEADMQGAGINGQGNSNGWAPFFQDIDGSSISYTATNTIQAGINWMGTARGRFGYLIAPTLLAYATGGLAYGGTYLKTSPQTTETESYDGGFAIPYFQSTHNSLQSLNVGWVAGGGAEWMMTSNWSIKGEALYYDLGNSAVSNTTFLSVPYALSVNPIGGSTTRSYYQGVIARAGINYHFNIGSLPVAAKY
jgi:outer membrane immunogenic protein